MNAKLYEIDLQNDFEVNQKKPPVQEKSYISIAKQDFEGQLLEHKMATLKEMFDL